ncbi:unnamed protein product [Pieris brassicae]|uniref:Uncharacterized protein n=1 Tax=Pieris brassicae TaxID=7116 RepID=A0A9P0TY40_PIEBR|nr:unnamed protein product [Pieris brassicae]
MARTPHAPAPDNVVFQVFVRSLDQQDPVQINRYALEYMQQYYLGEPRAFQPENEHSTRSLARRNAPAEVIPATSSDGWTVRGDTAALKEAQIKVDLKEADI